MIMKKIVAPELRVVRFESNDIITTSGPHVSGGSTGTDYNDPTNQAGDELTAPGRNSSLWD